MEYGVYGNLIKMYPKPYSIYLRRAVGLAEVKSNLEVEDFISYLFCPICSLVQEAGESCGIPSPFSDEVALKV